MKEKQPKKSSTKKRNRFFSFERFYAHPLVMLLVILGITIFFALQLLYVQLDNNNFRFIPKTDPARMADQKISEIFGPELPIMIGIKREYSTILDKQFLDKVRELIKEFNTIKLVKTDGVISVLSTKHIESGIGGESIHTDDLIPENFTGSPEEISAVREKLRDWELYSRSLISDDLKSMQIMIFLDTEHSSSGGPEAMAACQQIMAMLDNWDCPDAETYITGMTIFSEIINEATAHDLKFLIPLVIIVVVVVLFLSFRRFTGIYLPLLTVIISTIWAIGAMSLCRVPLSILSTVLPVILIAIGSAYGIHVINHYFDQVVQDTTISKEEHAKQVINSIRHIIRPVFLAALTTFAGFVSFCFTSVPPIFEFGIFSSFGVIAAFSIAVTLIPAILILRGPRKPIMSQLFKKRRKTEEQLEQRSRRMDQVITSTLLVINNHRRTILFGMLLLVVFSGLGMSRLVIDNVMMEYFEPTVPVVQSDVFIREKFGGSKLLNVLISTPDKDETILRPDVLQAMDGLTTYLEKNVPDVGKVTSIVPLIKRINQVYNADASPEGLPERKVIAESSSADDGFGDFGSDNDDSFGDFSIDESETAEHTNSSSYKIPEYNFPTLLTNLNKIIRNSDKDTMTADELVTELEKQNNYRGLAYYEIPSDPKKYGVSTEKELEAIINDYLVLLAGNSKGFVDEPIKPRILKMNLQLRTLGQKDSDQVLDTVKKYIQNEFPQDLQIEYGGYALIEKSLNHLVVESQLISLAVSFVIVFLIIAIYYRSVVAGLIGSVPLFISIMVNFGVMGYFGIKLNIGTAMVASFAIGIGIDYTIHYLAAYHSAYLQNKGENFLPQTFYGSGKAYCLMRHRLERALRC
ncbi:efflux RND transporter permease subunit [Treponema phagedenis]|uniref:efflux RND transporter permease subunit n=1 Tax=Treponema phagedenis TaxID=162 RepID=UPI0021CCD74C|nr:efflux RND transporter permease subunit [Treponema phagedenis]